MKILQDKTQLLDQDEKLVLSLRMDVELNDDDPLMQKDWLMNKIRGSITNYIHIKDVVTKTEEERIKIELPEYKKCPITKIVVDGSITGKGAVLLGIITEEERLIMKSKDNRGVTLGGKKKSKSKTLPNPAKFIDYNESYCTSMYATNIEGIERGNGIVTIVL